MSIFAKMVMTIVFLLLVVFVMFFLFNRHNQNFAKQELNASDFNRLVFFQRQLDTTIEQFSKMAFTLKRDPDAVKFQVNRSTATWFDVLSNKNELAEKINLQSSASSWTNYITIYSPLADDYVATYFAPPFDKLAYSDLVPDTWTYRGGHFVFYSVDPVQAYNALDTANLIVEVGLPADQLISQLDQLKASSGSDPFYYHPAYGLVVNSTGQSQWIEKIYSQVKDGDAAGSLNMELQGEKFLIHFAKSELLGGYFIDYTPIDRVFRPIETSSRYFYLLSLLLLLVAVMSALLLYRNVQSPIRELIRGVEKLQAGKFAIRVRKHANREFAYLFDQFNQFSSQIQELIEKISSAKVQIKDAELKQLQSQINPHFLYNCLAFIQSTAQLGNTKAVIAMSQSLGHYYRFTTRVDDQTVKLGEEIGLVRHYLEIQKLQLHRLAYEISLPDALYELDIPKLIIQPIVENAIIHGIERTVGQGIIRISGFEHESAYELIVEDNGREASEQLAQRLQRSMNETKREDGGFGLRNIHMRLRYRFNERSGLRFAVSPLGGLMVTVYLEKQA